MSGTSTRPIAFAGEPGAFAEDAVLTAFGDVARAPLASFRAVFDAVAAGVAAAGVVPIENVIHGTVRENYDLLIEFDLVIVGEVMVPVQLCLAALPGERIDDIVRVSSHIQALGQAEAFLRSRPWQLLSTYNTAGAGKSIVDNGDRGAAAVLSPRAAALFGLEVLVDEIGDLPDNRTRFVVIARGDATTPLLGDPPSARRTTLVVAVRNEPGTLLAVLQVLADHGLNMR
jgi:prephenate dehydratase